MTISSETEKWLTAGMKGWNAADPDIQRLVVEFSLMWQLVEGKLFDANFGNWRRGRNTSVRNAHPEQWPTFDLTFSEVALAIEYFSKRYSDRALFDRLMNDLDRDARPLIEKGLGLHPASPSDAEKRQALMLVIYRLRNNLFHGGKGQSGLAGQAENLRHAVNVMHALCEANLRLVGSMGD